MRWGRDLTSAPPLIAVDESPDWVFLAGCSPAEPASASPAGAIMPVINLARQCFSTERRNVAYPVVSAQGSTPRKQHNALSLLLMRTKYLRHVPNMSPQVTSRSLTRGGQRVQIWASNRRRHFPTEPQREPA